MELTDAEAEAMNLGAGWNDLTGDEALTFVRLKLDGDDPARSRGYDMLMQLLYAGVNSGDLGSMLGLGTKLLGSMDTNLNAMSRRHAGFRRQGRRRPQRNGAADGGAGDERKPAAGRRNGHAEHGERGSCMNNREVTAADVAHAAKQASFALGRVAEQDAQQRAAGNCRRPPRESRTDFQSERYRYAAGRKGRAGRARAQAAQV